jgi:hypothetical protein
MIFIYKTVEKLMKKIVLLFLAIFLFQYPIRAIADYPAIVKGWYEGDVSMMPTGTGRIDDWHAHYPGYPDMYTVPGECTFDGQTLEIRCSNGCSGYFTCHADYYCYDGTTPINGICRGDVLPKLPNLGGPPDNCH